MAIDSEEQKVRPTGNLGIERYVQLAYFVSWVMIAWFLVKVGDSVWGRLSDTVDAVPEPNQSLIAIAAAVISFVTAVVLYRSSKVHGFTTEVCNELSKVTWPTRPDTWSHTIVVLIVTAIAAVILGTFDAMWSTITDLIYG